MAVLAGFVGSARADDSLHDSLHALRELGRDDYPFVAATKGATRALNKQFRADSQLHAAAGRGWQCKMSFMTTQIVSWRCQDDDAHLGQDVAINAVYELAGETMTPVTFDTIFPPGPDREAKLAQLQGRVGTTDYASLPAKPCGVPATRGAIYLASSDGLEVLARADSPSGCFFAHATILPLLAPGSRLAVGVDARVTARWIQLQIEPRVLEPDEPDYIQPRNIPPGKTRPDRFVVIDKDSVRDTGTGLIWASHDNGADLDADDARAYANSYRAGGFTTWRLPTSEELFYLQTEDLAHREPGDCTGGKSNYLITPLIRLSCGLLWSARGNAATATARGFISGNEREVPRATTKNYRVLPVRRP